jgi:hypothetical protein
MLAGREKVGLLGVGQIVGYGHTGSANTNADGDRQP